jgi:hypothetical protein
MHKVVDVSTNAIVDALGECALSDRIKFLRILRDYSGHLEALGSGEITYQGKIELGVVLGLA